MAQWGNRYALAACLVVGIVSAASAQSDPAAPPLLPPTPTLPGEPLATSPAPTVAAAEPKPDPICPPPSKGLFDTLHQDDNYGFKSLFDTLHQPPTGKPKPWYDKLSVRGYSQFRYGRTLGQDPNGAEPVLLGDRLVNGNAENFFIRRARFILFGDVSDHLGIYAQPDFASTPSGSQTSTYFGQLRDLYGDVYVDTDKVNRFRVGLSKVPYGFENMQSSQNRVPLDRTDAINSAVSPNERDLGVFYYWTPKEKQDLFRDLVAGGLKGSGNFGIFALGVYNGQGGSQFEQNLNMHTVARATLPFRLDSGQVVEVSVQGYTGDYVVEGVAIRPLGQGTAAIPSGTRTTGGTSGFRDQRIAGTFVWYPQPFGFQTEWNVGEGPGLNPAQTAIETRSLSGGYVMGMYKYETESAGNVIPYCRYQHFMGGYRSVANAPYGSHDQWDIGVEWHFRREMELTLEYSIVDGVDLDTPVGTNTIPYQNFQGGIIRLQFQINY